MTGDRTPARPYVVGRRRYHRSIVRGSPKTLTHPRARAIAGPGPALPGAAIESAGVGPDPPASAARFPPPTYPVLVSVYPDQFSQPTTTDLAWDDLAKSLSAPRVSACIYGACTGHECPHKTGPAWSPAIYPPGSRRLAESVSSVSALVYDLDDISAADLAAVGERLTGLDYIAHSSHSDTPENRRLRLVIAVDRPLIGPDEYRATWKAGALALGIPSDPQTSDPNRLYYMPSRPAGAPYFYARQPGTALAVGRLLNYAPQAAERSPKPAPSPAKAKGDPSRAAALLAAAWPAKGRHSASLALCGALAREGWEPEAIADFVATVVGLVPGGEPNLAKRLSQAKSSVAKVAAGLEVAGWGTLAQSLTIPAAIDDTRKALGFYDSSFADALALAIPVLPTEPVPAADSDLPPLLSEIAAKPLPKIRVYKTGIPELDEKLGGGIYTRALHTICAPPAAGKSGLAIELEIALALQGIPVLKISTELESSEVLARYASNRRGFAWRDALRDRIPQSEIVAGVDGLPIHVIGSEMVPREPGKALELIARAAIVIGKKYGKPAAIVVDYMQDMIDFAETDQKGQVGSIARTLLRTAQILDTFVLAVSSVNRSWYSPRKAEELRKENDATAYLTAAKESGGVDFASSTIIFVDVDHSEVHSEGYKIARLALAKVRAGETGFVGCRFYGATGRWLPDVSAALVLASGAKGLEKAMARAKETEEKLLAVASRQPLTRTLLRDSCGLSKKAAEEAIAQCLADGRLKMFELKQQTGDGRFRLTKLIAVASYQIPYSGAAPAPEKSTAPDPIVAKWLSP